MFEFEFEGQESSSPKKVICHIDVYFWIEWKGTEWVMTNFSKLFPFFFFSSRINWNRANKNSFPLCQYSNQKRMKLPSCRARISSSVQLWTISNEHSRRISYSSARGYRDRATKRSGKSSSAPNRPARSHSTTKNSYITFLHSLFSSFTTIFFKHEHDTDGNIKNRELWKLFFFFSELVHIYGHVFLSMVVVAMFVINVLQYWNYGLTVATAREANELVIG